MGWIPFKTLTPLYVGARRIRFPAVLAHGHMSRFMCHAVGAITICVQRNNPRIIIALPIDGTKRHWSVVDGSTRHGHGARGRRILSFRGSVDWRIRELDANKTPAVETFSLSNSLVSKCSHLSQKPTSTNRSDP
ncbi:hypothetical protein TWF718_011417 [Orbilia javanica]|uniref:Uncharacterized protein n=1 Tax=Orbilia javanica TaxID=47235 RepID=A0AAN8MRJ5_9PEZI